MKVCFIVNPAAGFGRGQKRLPNVIDQLLKLGYLVESVETKYRGHATYLAQQAIKEAFDIVVAVGGDGTVNEICNGLVRSDTALAVLPVGTGNVYAADVGIPIWSPLSPRAVSKATEVIVTGQRHRLDLGRLHLSDGVSRYFLMWCGIGLDATIIQTVRPDDTQRLGFAGWVMPILMKTFSFTGTFTTIAMDNDVIKKQILLTLVSNGQLYGRFWRVTPRAQMDDGLLDVAVATGYDWSSTIKHLVSLTFGQHEKSPDFSIYRTTRLSILSEKALSIHVDGELVGTTPMEIEIIPLALNVIIPKNAPARLFSGL